ncbi:MAG: sulfite exporter TauE/SafE family protein [Patescibacteria group bacterium]
MFHTIKVHLEGVESIDDKIRIETEIEVLAGVQSVLVNEQTGEASVEFDKESIAQDEIIQALRSLGYRVIADPAQSAQLTQEHTYYVKGMHCASCEVLIEKKLLKLDGIRSVEASTNKGEVVIEYRDKKPNIAELDQLFKQDGYRFFNHPTREAEVQKKSNAGAVIGISLAIIAVFILFNKLGIGALVNVSARSSLPSFFLLGLLAGLSTCAALVGGIILSMSKQWHELYAREATLISKLQPHLLFNAGRMASYAFFGAVLGAVGSQLRISLTFSSLLVIGVSGFMLLLGLQMLGVKAFQKFQFTLPKSITRRIADESKFKGRFLPSLMGAFTFFLPCGFTITAQGLALLSGSALQGGLIMFSFALGTALPLLMIGLSSVTFASRPHLSSSFLKVAGVVVLFFALFNINSQLNALGAPSLSNFSLKAATSATNGAAKTDDKDLPAMVNGVQVIKMEASSQGYKPNYFKVRAGVPVRWEITDTGTSGCTNAVLARGLFSGQIDLTPGTTSVKEFTVPKAGKYKFSCWMGMISGVIEAVSADRADAPTLSGAALSDNSPVPSGASGCGCGGGGSGSCGVPQ